MHLHFEFKIWLHSVKSWEVVLKRFLCGCAMLHRVYPEKIYNWTEQRVVKEGFFLFECATQFFDFGLAVRAFLNGDQRYFQKMSITLKFSLLFKTN